MEKTDSFFDNTMLSGYKGCPTFYQLRHVKGWRSEGTAMPLIFGLCWHDAMDIVWQHAKQLGKDELHVAAVAKFHETWAENGMPETPSMEELEKFGFRNPMVASEMLFNYIDQRWDMLQNCKLIACEQPFAVPMPGSQGVWYIGRLDKVIEFNGQQLVIEHKTTSEYKKDGGFKSAYLEGWFSDSQVKGYQFGAGLFYPGLKQVWVDCSLVHKTVHDKFRFVPVEHPFPILQEWIQDANEWIGRVRLDCEKNYFPKNENSCIGKFGPCPMLSICRTTNNPGLLAEPPAGYIVDRWSPFDILGLDKLLNKESTSA